MKQKGNQERGTGNQIFSGVLIFDDSFGTAIVALPLENCIERF
ncbi:hypothetical protein CKA32_002450 [Geitlerinema sp. FC II]|nr:hypothetical protein CKA32_002450 [Geitlerinema sp. FC II]